MTARGRGRVTGRQGGARHGVTRAGLPRHAVPRSTVARRVNRAVPALQRGWWVVGAAGGLVAMLGFQALPPARRLELVERVNARQDSVFAATAQTQREALDTIRRQLGQLLAGQCAKERDRMARVVYGCGGR